MPGQTHQTASATTAQAHEATHRAQANAVGLGNSALLGGLSGLAATGVAHTTPALGGGWQAQLGQDSGVGTAPEIGGADTTLDVSAWVEWLSDVGADFSSRADTIRGLEAGSPERATLVSELQTEASALATTLEARADTIRTRLEEIMRATSDLREQRAADGTITDPPTAQLPDTATIDRIRTLAHGLQLFGGSDADLTPAVEALATGRSATADAALALYQAHSVLGARQDWETGYEQPTLRSAADMSDASTRMRRTDGAQDGLNDVFADSGFNRYGVQATRANGQWEPADWCGMFVVRHLFRSGGLDGELRAGFLETTNVLDFFAYTQLSNARRVPVTTWSVEAGSWVDLSTYHEGRGSQRTWTDRDTIESELDAGQTPFRSGDVALVNHSGGDTPQHIVMVDHYNPDTGELVTIEGNTLGIHSNDSGQIERTGDGGYAQDGDNTSVGLHVREMTSDTRDVQPGAGGYRNRAGTTIVGVGRLSAVDFEDRHYSTLPIGRFPAPSLTMDPDEMNRAQRNGAGVSTARGRGTDS